MSIHKRAKDMWVSDLVKKLEELEEENKKLSEENGQLKEKIQTLELRLDNKEKLNEEYRKQLDKLRTDNIYEEWLYD